MGRSKAIPRAVVSGFFAGSSFKVAPNHVLEQPAAARRQMVGDPGGGSNNY
jgi:hypothetical protein